MSENPKTIQRLSNGHASSIQTRETNRQVPDADRLRCGDSAARSRFSEYRGTVIPNRVGQCSSVVRRPLDWIRLVFFSLTLLNVLSLDAVLVAWVWQWTISLSCLGDLPQWPSTMVLCLTVWLVYVVDRLLDASRLSAHRPRTRRHHFHAMYPRAILCFWSAGLMVDVTIAICWLSADQIRVGLIAATLVLLYLALIHVLPHRPRNQAESRSSAFKFGVPKEHMIGLVFGFGVMLPIWESGITVQAVLTFGLASLLFSTNCLCVAWLEKRFDQQQGFASFATRAGRVQKNSLIFLSATALATLSAAVFYVGSGHLLMVVFSVGLVLSTTRFLHVQSESTARVAAKSTARDVDWERVPPGVWIDVATLSAPAIVIGICPEVLG